MKTEILSVTPEMAEKFLRKNKSNRIISKERVSLYSSIMLKGEWELNGEALIFDKEDNLLNGQHRLSAVIKANCNVEFLIVSGVHNSAFKTIDSGKSRNAQDVFRIDGILNSSTVAGGVSRYLKLVRGINSIDQSKIYANISNKDILDEYTENSELYQNLFHRSSSFYRTNHRILTKSDYIGFYRLFQTKYNTDVIDRFFDSIEQGVGICGILKNRLLSDVISKRKATSAEKTAIIIKAFNHFNSGKEVKLLKYSITEKFPTIQ